MRFPAVMGRFYPASSDGLRSSVESCFAHPLGPGLPGQEGSGRRIRGAVVPHAGYMASGMNAAHAFRAIKEDGLPEAYVVIGPDHYGTADGTVLCSEEYATPLGTCKIDVPILEALADVFEDDPSAHAMEHSIEVEVPFLQYIDPDPKIVPVMMGRQTPREAARLASALRKACEGRDVVVIASTDLAHYVPKNVAARLDSMVESRVRAMDPDGLYSDVRSYRITMCGYGPVMAAMMFCEGCQARILSHTDSFDSLGLDRDSVVDYMSAVFEKG
ncbi:MAG: AmmeMemoRadiSam system protein B [Candidatus Methanomethylophilaceae archaeon]|nr:AmmeMemoRadiSam system protein B [Candidatus Methanomethylophilaceae archaeon]